MILRSKLSPDRLLCLFMLVLSGALFLIGCKSKSQPSKELHVFSASSLTEAFQDLKRGFTTAHPGVKVSLTFAGSQVLRLQIEQGATADVFASANPAHMKALVKAGHVHKSQVFAHNELVVIVPPHNPAKLRSFADLSRATRLVLGTKQVPIGSYTRKVLQRAAGKYGAKFRATVLSHVVSEESNVRLVRAKVELGEADAAIVYRTDAIASKRVQLLPIPDAINVRADYSIGIVKNTRHPTWARQWLAFLASPRGRAILKAHGFVVK